MNGDWLLLTQAAPATIATNFSLAVVKSLCGTINALTRPLQRLPPSLMASCNCYIKHLRKQL